MNIHKNPNKLNAFNFTKFISLISHFTALTFFISFSPSIAFDLQIYDNSSESGAGPLSRQKTYAINESSHPKNAGISLLYADTGMTAPKVPLIHPYDDFNGGTKARTDVGIVRVPLVMHVPNDYLWNLPEPITERIRSTGVTDISIFMVAQNMPWNSEVPLLFRPHYGIFPSAPTIGTENIYFGTTVGLFYSDAGNLSLDNTPVNEFKDEELALHPHNHAARTPATVPDNLALSGDVLHIQNLSHNTPQSVWSYVEYLDFNTSARTALVTLHWLLTGEQTTAIYDAFQHEVPGGNISSDRLFPLFHNLEKDPAFAISSGGFLKLQELLGIKPE